MIPAPANGIINEVVTELLCTTAVINIPNKNPITAFLNKYLFTIISSRVITNFRIDLVNSDNDINNRINEKIANKTYVYGK